VQRKHSERVNLAQLPTIVLHKVAEMNGIAKTWSTESDDEEAPVPVDVDSATVANVIV